LPCALLPGSTIFCSLSWAPLRSHHPLLTPRPRRPTPQTPRPVASPTRVSARAPAPHSPLLLPPVGRPRPNPDFSLASSPLAPAVPPAMLAYPVAPRLPDPRAPRPPPARLTSGASSTPPSPLLRAGSVFPFFLPPIPRRPPSHASLRWFHSGPTQHALHVSPSSPTWAPLSSISAPPHPSAPRNPALSFLRRYMLPILTAHRFLFFLTPLPHLPSTPPVPPSSCPLSTHSLAFKCPIFRPSPLSSAFLDCACSLSSSSPRPPSPVPLPTDYLHLLCSAPSIPPLRALAAPLTRWALVLFFFACEVTISLLNTSLEPPSDPSLH